MPHSIAELLFGEYEIFIILCKVSAGLAVAERLNQNAIILGLMPHTARNDGWMYTQLLCQYQHILGQVAGADGRFFPGSMRNESFACHVVCLAFFAILFIRAIQVVGE